MYCGIDLVPGEGVPVRYNLEHLPAFRTTEDIDWECVDQVACAARIRYNEDPPPGPERLIITATDAKGQPLL